MRRAALVAAGAAAAPATVDPLCAQLLPPREGEKLAGVKPLELVPRGAVRLAGGTCSCATIVKGERTIVFLPPLALDTTADELERPRGVAVKPRAAWGLGAAGSRPMSA